MGIGWRIQCSSSMEFIKGSFASQCQDGNSYRAELLGIYALLVILHTTIKLHSPQHPSGILYCDNESAIKLISSLTFHIHPQHKHSDVLHDIRHVKQMLSCNLRFHHIRGHQDKNRHLMELSLPAKLNCRCDSLAK